MVMFSSKGVYTARIQTKLWFGFWKRYKIKYTSISRLFESESFCENDVLPYYIGSYSAWKR